MVDNRVMTTRELADYIKLNEKTIIKMAQNGDLPGVKIGNQWRFPLESIDKYLQNDIVKAKDEDLDRVINTASDVITLSRLTDSNLINLDISATEISDVLQILTQIAVDANLTTSQNELYQQLKEREEMLSTAVGEGVAVPHMRHPNEKIFSKSNIIIARSRQGVNFGAPDQKLVHIFFMTCAPTEFSHIRLLAKIAKFLHKEGTFEKIMQADTVDNVVQILMAFDRDQIFLKQG